MEPSERLQERSRKDQREGLGHSKARAWPKKKRFPSVRLVRGGPGLRANPLDPGGGEDVVKKCWSLRVLLRFPEF